jgi:vacuolar-type H+-ATPase subunit F/Vma7
MIRATVDDYDGMIPTVLEIPSKDNPYDPNKVIPTILEMIPTVLEIPSKDNPYDPNKVDTHTHDHTHTRPPWETKGSSK